SMCNQAPQNNELRRVMDACLPGLENKPDFERDVLRQVRGEVKVKKKLSVGFVLLMVLVLAAVTALAAMTLNAYYEKAIEKEGQSGLIQDWSASDKVALVDWMVEAGAKLDAEQVAQLHANHLTEDEQGTLALEIINSYYPARDGILTSVDIIAKEKGPIEYWSLEDKAWFSEMIVKYQPEEVSGVNLLPTEADITQEQAIEIMYAYYEKEYGLKREDFDESKMSISFSENTWDDGTGPERLKTWSMNLWLKADGKYPLGISILPDGTVKQASGPYVASWRDEWYDTLMQSDFWSIEGLYRFKQEWEPKIKQLQASGEQIDSKELVYLLGIDFELPQKNDITRDQAFSNAQAALLKAKGWNDEKLNLYGTREAYRLDASKRPEYYFVFTFWTSAISDQQREKAQELFNKGDIPHKIIVRINAKTGDVIEIRDDNNPDASGM
ncbi:MAG: hypothetical protein RR547_12290, partial [Raoultibacter sp.]